MCDLASIRTSILEAMSLKATQDDTRRARAMPRMPKKSSTGAKENEPPKTPAGNKGGNRFGNKNKRKTPHPDTSAASPSSVAASPSSKETKEKAEAEEQEEEDSHHAPAKKKKQKTEVVTYDESDLSKHLPNNFLLYALKNGQYREVKIVEKRKRQVKADEKKQMVKEEEEAPVDPNDLTKHGWDYYVHYVEWDRRMDEWVSRKLLLLPSELKKGKSESSKRRSSQKTGKGKGQGKANGEKDDGNDKTAASKAKAKADGGDGEHIGAGEGDEEKEAVVAPSGGNVHGHGGHGNFTEEDIRAHEEATKVKNIEKIVYGPYDITTWYYSPFPQEFSNRYNTLYFCEFCLTYFGHPSEHQRHMKKCKLRHPPGNEIYRSKEQNVTVSVWEVDGAKETIYCQNLCYIAKLFLDHKTLEFDCSPFLFYIVTEVDERGCHMVGYFSKEKKSQANYNLACILTLPCHQRKGYGKFIISLSYELSKIEQKDGSPEKPISDLGKVSYVSYWSKTLLDILAKKQPGEAITIQELSKQTCITPADIIETLKNYLKILVWHKGKWVFNQMQMKHVLQEAQAKRKEKREADSTAIKVGDCKPELLHWTPYFVSKKHKKEAP
eukprot:g75544.t1